MKTPDAFTMGPAANAGGAMDPTNIPAAAAWPFTDTVPAREQGFTTSEAGQESFSTEEKEAPDWILGRAEPGGNARRWLAYPALHAPGGMQLLPRAILVIELKDGRLVVLNLDYQRAPSPLDQGMIDQLARSVATQVDRADSGQVEIWRHKGSTLVQFRGGHERFGPEEEFPRELAWSFALNADSDPLRVLFASPEQLHKWIKSKGRSTLPTPSDELFRHNIAWRALRVDKAAKRLTVSDRERFLLGLDRWALQFCVHHALISGKTYNYLLGDGAGIKQQRRRLAVERLPLLAALASDTDARSGGLQEAIDDGTSARKAMAVAYRTQLWLTTRLQQVSARWLNMMDPQQPERHRHQRYLLRVLAVIGPDNWPATDPEWSAFRGFFDGLLNIPPLAAIDGEEHFDHRVAGALLRELGASGWCAARQRIDRQYGSLIEFIGCLEFFRYLVMLFQSAEGGHELAVVCDRRLSRATNHSGERILVELLRVTPARLLGAARHWRQAQLCEVLAREAAQPVGTPLAFPLRNPLPIRGYFVHPLLDSVSMKLEGLAMDNCVGRLYQVCSTSSLRMFSVRDEAGHRLSTFDLSFRVSIGANGANALKIALSEHKARANRAPGEPAQEVVDAFIQYLNDDAEKLGLHQFALDLADSAEDNLHRIWDPVQEENEEQTIPRLRAAALIAREYLGDLLSKF